VKKLILSTVVFLTAFSTQAAAELLLKNKFTDDELVQILRDDGYSAVKRVKEKVVLVTVEGRKYILYNNTSGDLQTYYGVSGARVHLKDINEWNRSKRMSRAYLDKSGDPALEADLSAKAGLTARHVTEFFNTFKYSTRVFREYLRNLQ
jgi:hypothetical protein